MSISRIALAILTATSFTQVIAAPSHIDSKTITVSGTIMPQACTLSVTPSAIDFGVKTPASPEKDTDWVQFGTAAHDLKATINCAASAKTLLKFIDPKAAELQGAAFGPGPDNKAVFALGAKDKVVGGFVINLDKKPSAAGASASLASWSTQDVSGATKVDNPTSVIPLHYLGIAGGQNVQPVSGDVIYPMTVTPYLYGNSWVGLDDEFHGTVTLELYTL